MTGIYLLTNNINGKKYVGQAINIEKRLREHELRALRPTSDEYNTLCGRAIRKYGWENFTKEILQECSIEELNKQEKWWAEFHNCYMPHGYNMKICGTQNNGCFNKINIDQLNEIYYLLTNSNKTEKEIAKLFNLDNDTISQINVGKIWKNDHYRYPLRDFSLKQDTHIYTCNICGKQISPRAKLCKVCYNYQRLPRDILTKEALTADLLSLPTKTDVANKYGVSRATINRKIKHFGIVLPLKSKTHKFKEKRTIIQYDLLGNKMNEFSSASEAARFVAGTDISAYHIIEVSKGIRSTAFGFKWKEVRERITI